MANRYHVKSATCTFGSSSFEMASGPAAKSQTREAVDVTALNDSVKKFIKGALTENDEVTVTLYDKGTGMPTVDDSPASLTFAVTLSDGINADATANVAYNKAIVTKVSAPSHDGSGDRKATIDVTFRPDGSVATPAAQGGTGNV